MSPEYGATSSFFPTDEETIKYLKLSGRKENELDIVREYTKVQKQDDKQDVGKLCLENKHCKGTTNKCCISGVGPIPNRKMSIWEKTSVGLPKAISNSSSPEN